MSNFKIPESKWDRAREYYECGLSYSQIIEKTGISKSQISKRANADNWVKGNHKETLIASAVAVKRAFSGLNETERFVCNELVDERTKDLEFFRSASMIIAKKAIEKVQTEDLSMFDIEKAQNVIGKGKENIYGKTPDTAIQINNSTKEPEPQRPQVSKEEWLRLHGVSNE